MRTLRLLLIAIIAVVSMAVYGQQFHPLGLSDLVGRQSNDYYNPRMHVEDNMLYVCTRQGLYAKDLANDESLWQLVGFEEIPLMDFARWGNDILALRHNIDSCFLLLSHDGGQTYSDITPPLFIGNDPRNKHVLRRLVQRPDDPSTVFVLSNYRGLHRSTDFGQTWSQLAGFTLGSFAGYHPTRPEIMYQSGESDLMEPALSISYDSGQTWNYFCPTYRGMYASEIAFNPSDPDKWIYGDYHGFGTSDDNGHTWSWLGLSGDQYETGWEYISYDCENSDVIYAASNQRFIYTTDGGKSWSQPLMINSEGNTNIVYDLQQYGDRLLVYKGDDVYEISKTDLIPHNAVQNLESDDSQGTSVAYDLQGRRTSLQPKGIYIKNGKKYISTP